MMILSLGENDTVLLQSVDAQRHDSYRVSLMIARTKWALIKIKVPGKGTIADQSRINRDPKGDNRGGILFFPMSCVQKIKALFSYT